MKGKNAQGLTEQEFLGRYDPQKYEHPSVTVDVLIFTVDKSREADSLRILLDRREEHPFLHKWALPGSFVGMGESVEQAAARELEEATGLRTPYLEQLYTWGDLGRDPRTRIISVSYIALVPGETLLPEGEKGMPRGEWYNVSARGGQLRLWNGAGELTEADLAFDHAAMIRLALERMKNKLFYTDIAFHLLPEYFTLPEPPVYEAILGESLHSPNFRRDMQKWVERTERKSRPPKAGKPAWYYRQKKERTGNLE